VVVKLIRVISGIIAVRVVRVVRVIRVIIGLIMKGHIYWQPQQLLWF
jgi:hypothetical protein